MVMLLVIQYVKMVHVIRYFQNISMKLMKFERILIPTIHSYMDELSRRYGESDTIDINRNGINAFEFIIEGLNIVATVDFV